MGVEVLPKAGRDGEGQALFAVAQSPGSPHCLPTNPQIKSCSEDVGEV